MADRTGEEIMAKARERTTRPPTGCRRHSHDVPGCAGCAGSFVDRVAWLLAHPDEMFTDERVDRPKLDPTPCGVCGCVIGEGLMVMHMAVCPGRLAIVEASDG